jgi:dynein assembly factor 2
LPSEIAITIFLKHIESTKDAKLDINESTLLFEYPGLYYLDINLMYKVDSNAGSAKFDKSKKTLLIRVPVVGRSTLQRFSRVRKKKK